MAEKILVALRRNDQMESIVPYLERIVKPGMELLFLFPYPVEPWPCLRHYWIEADSARQARLAARKIANQGSWETQKELARQMLAPAYRALQDKDIQLEVDLYTGSLRRLLQDYKANTDIHWILTTSPAGSWIRYMSIKALASFGWSSCMLSIRLQGN